MLGPKALCDAPRQLIRRPRFVTQIIPSFAQAGRGLKLPSMFEDKAKIRARAFLLGERLDLKPLAQSESLDENPLVLEAGASGAAVLFRYGVVVVFGLTPVEEAAFLEQMRAWVSEPFAHTESEEVEIERAEGPDKLERGIVKVRAFSPALLQIVADVLAKSVVLAHYEDGVARTFESIAPFASGLRKRRGKLRGDKELLATIGDILLIEQRTVGIAEIGDKPESLWERPELERLYARLEDEFELRERQAALDRKLAVISRTAETALNLLQHQSGLRVEWAVAALIVFEILLNLWELWHRR